jgi:hypothetical protein
MLSKQITQEGVFVYPIALIGYCLQDGKEEVVGDLLLPGLFVSLGLSAIMIYLISLWSIESPLANANLDEGKTLSAQYCAACHGTNLQGQPNWQTRKARWAIASTSSR